MCFPFSPGKRETHKQFDPHPFPGQSREVVCVYWFFSRLSVGVIKPLASDRGAGEEPLQIGNKECREERWKECRSPKDLCHTRERHCFQHSSWHPPCSRQCVQCFAGVPLQHPCLRPIASSSWAPSKGRELNTNFFFSNFSGTPGISRQNPGISRQKSLISLVSRDILNFLAPPLRVEDPYPTGKYPDSKVWVCALFSFLTKNPTSHKKVHWSLQSTTGSMRIFWLFGCGFFAYNWKLPAYS